MSCFLTKMETNDFLTRFKSKKTNDPLMKKWLLLFILLNLYPLAAADIIPVRIHYQGGGDWYGNKTVWKNILNRAQKVLALPTGKREVAYKISDPEFIQYPIAYISGHGNIHFSDTEAGILRRWLTAGGFLWADDDYGMDKSFRREMKKVFPELRFVELSFLHPIYHGVYGFSNGLPKIHEHAGGPPKGMALIYHGRVVCFYSFNTDISDGCEDAGIHDDPMAVRESALRMAVNILYYALTN